MKSINVKYYRSILQTIFLSGLFTSVFIFWPWADIPFEIPKILFISRWIEIIGVLGLIFAAYIIKKEKSDKLLIFLVTIFFLEIFVSSLVGTDFSKSLHGNYYRGDGIFTLIHMIIFFLFTVLFFQKSWLHKVSKIIGVSSSVLSLITLINWLSSRLTAFAFFEAWENGSQGSTFGNPNFLSGYLVVTLPFTYELVRNQKSNLEKALYLIFIMIHIGAIFLTRSTFGILGIIVFSLLLFSFLLKNRILVFSSIVMIILVLVGSIFLFFKYSSDSKILVAEGRERIIRKAILAYQKKPLVGWGWANFDYAFESVTWPIQLESDVYVDKAHSTFLEILITAGLLGFLTYSFLLIRIFLNLYSQKAFFMPYFISFVLLVIHSQTNVISISEELIFWLTAGISAKYFYEV